MECHLHVYEQACVLNNHYVYNEDVTVVSVISATIVIYVCRDNSIHVGVYKIDVWKENTSF